MISLLFWSLLCTNMYPGIAEDALHFPAVNRTWLKSVMLKTFATKRHHVTGIDDKMKAKDFIVEHFKSLHLTVQYDEFVSEKLKVPGVNIIGILPGLQPDDSVDTIYIVGAYYDTKAVTEGLFNNGAGVVAMLESARLLVQLGRKQNTLLFVAFDLHATGDRNKERCCQGAKHFVTVWLQEYIKERRKKNEKIEYGGIIALESILNYDSDPYIQRVNVGGIASVLMFEDLTALVAQNYFRGDFMLVVCTDKDAELQEPFMQIWNFFPEMTAKIYSLKFSLGFTNKLIYEIIEEKVLESDILAFYTTNKKGILITDTEKQRGIMFLHQCHQIRCNETTYLTNDKITFVVKTVGTVVLTVDLLANGNTSDVVRSHMRHLTYNFTTTTATVIEPSEQKCPKGDYLYDKRVKQYFKKHAYVFDRVPWSEAKAICENEDAQLLIIRNEEMLDFSIREGFGEPIWVGMSDIQTEGEWKWVDGTNVTIDFWDTCQPDDSLFGEDCGMLHHANRKIIDVNCNAHYVPFICTCESNETMILEDEIQEEDCFVNGYNVVENDILSYKVFEIFLNHDDAENTCTSDGAQLLSISTLYEYSFINKLRSELGDILYHIQSDERFYQLFLKTDLNETSTRNLNNDSNNCFVLNGSLLSLDSRNCSDKLPFICGIYCNEKDLNKPFPNETDYEQGYFESFEILASTDKGINHFIIKTQVHLSFIKEIRTGEPVYSMDILYQKNVLFWHSRESTYIMETAMADFPDYMHRRFVSTGDPHTYIAVDWLYENVYWSTMVLQTISVSNGNYTKILYIKDIHKPRFLQLDSFSGVLFWLEPLGLMCGTMDGQEKVRIVIGNFDQIVVDAFLKTLFSSHDSFIKREQFHPSEKFLKEIVYDYAFTSTDCLNKHRSSGNIDVKVHGGTIPIRSYMHDINTKNKFPLSFADIVFIDAESFIGMKNIFKLGKPNEIYLQNVHHLHEQWINVKIIDERKIQCLYQECTYVNDSCSKLKLPAFPNSFSCVCPLDGAFLTAINGSCNISICSNDNGKCSQQCNEVDYYPYIYCSCFDGFQLLFDGKTCIKEDDIQTFILFSDKTDLELYSPQGKFEYRQKIDIKDFETYAFAGITFDPLDFKIYWVQDKVFGIRRANINGTGKEECYSGSLKELRALTFDVFQRRLIFSVPQNSSIESVDVDGKHHQVVHQLPTVYYPSSIVLDTFNGFIYYHQQNQVNISNTGIYRVNIETKQVEAIIEKMGGPVTLRSFDVDHRDGFIFFIGGDYKEQIEKQQIHGTNGKVLISKTQLIQFTHLYLLDDDLYIIGINGEFGKYNIKEDVGELLTKSFNQIISIAGGHYQSKLNTSEKDIKSCIETSKCLDASMDLICLTSEQICDGVDQCYDSYDEMYCEHKEHLNKYTYIHLSCLKELLPHEYVYDRRDLLFVNWETHLFSRFINFKDFSMIRCSVEYEISNPKESSKQTFKLTSFYMYHRFRQIIKSNVLRGRHQYIRKLVLSGEGISQIWSHITFEDLRNLQTLELLGITLSVLKNGIFINLSQLNTLQMRLKSLVQIEPNAFIGIHQCRTLTIAGTKINRLHPETFNNLKKLTRLDISNNKLTLLEQGMFTNTTSLQILDTRGNDLYIAARLFDTNINLKLIYSDTFAVCCVTPKHMPSDGCIAPHFDVSSCDSLIENNVLRIFLWIIGLLAVGGNILVLIYRITNEGGLFNDTFSVLVGNLTVADTLIGVYLISIGIADAVFRGEYIWREYKWRNSTLCSTLGILSVLSSQVSVLTISFVTVARYFVVKFPFKEHKISRKNAVTGCVIIWMFSLLMGLFPYFAFEHYYSASGVCVSLPLQKETTAGWIYSFSLFVVFNFLTFLFIALAQGPIVFEVKKISSRIQRTGNSKHIEVAKKLTFVVATDCLCWIPIGTMGIMAMFGYDLPRTIYAWTVVFVLPINSAINPFLYTLVDAELLGRILKDISKRCWKVIGFLSIGISIILIIGMLVLIKDTEDIFKIHRQLHQEASKKRHDAEIVATQANYLHLKLKYLKEEAQNDNCYSMLKKTGTGYCCLDWTDFKKQCFIINNEERNWYDAEISCRQNGHLATVDNVNTSTFLTSILVDSGTNLTFWIGLYESWQLNVHEYRWVETNALYEEERLEISTYAHSTCVYWEGPRKYRMLLHSCYRNKGFICRIDYGRRRKYVPVSLCPYGWYKIGNTCYIADTTTIAWVGAIEICKQYGNSYSATIDSAEVNDRLRPMLRKLEENLMNKFWIGLYYDQGDWRWFKTREPANYTNWEQGEPQVWDRCAMYAKSLGTFVWRGSYQCSWKPFYNFICEKELYHFYQ